MNKLYTLAAAAVFGTMAASAATMPVVFNGTDSEGWTYGDNAVIENGHLDHQQPGCGLRQEQYYTTGGVRVASGALSAGIYICRKGNAVTKVVLYIADRQGRAARRAFAVSEPGRRALNVR